MLITMYMIEWKAYGLWNQTHLPLNSSSFKVSRLSVDMLNYLSLTVASTMVRGIENREAMNTQ